MGRGPEQTLLPRRQPGSFKIKLHIHVPAISLLGIYPREMDTYVLEKICTQMFVTDLFIVGKNWKQPSHLKIGKWLIKFLVTS